jgi:DNA-binding transcriptional regulator YiaG
MAHAPMSITPQAARILQLKQARDWARNGRAREIREHADLSPADVASVVGVATSTVWRWETGQRRPYGDAAVRYAAFLDHLDEMRRTA